MDLNLVCIVCMNLQRENVENPPTCTDSVSPTAPFPITIMAIDL